VRSQPEARLLGYVAWVFVLESSFVERYRCR